MTSLAIPAAGMMAAFVFCVIRTVFDLRARRFGWGIAGAAVGALLFWGLATPITTHAVKVDLPVIS